MHKFTSISAFTLIVLSASFTLTEQQPSQSIDVPDPAYQPNWTILLLVFIISSGVAAIVGAVLLVKQPLIPDLPELGEPNRPPNSGVEASISVLPHSTEPIMTTYKRYSQQHDPASYPMRPVRSYQPEPISLFEERSQRSQRSTLQSHQPYQRQPSYPPVTVMTQRM